MSEEISDKCKECAVDNAVYECIEDKGAVYRRTYSFVPFCLRSVDKRLKCPFASENYTLVYLGDCFRFFKTCQL